MLMLFACFVTFLFISSKDETFGWTGTAGGLLVMEGSGSNEDRVPMLDRAAVTVAAKWETQKEDKTGANEEQTQGVTSD